MAFFLLKFRKVCLMSITTEPNLSVIHTHDLALTRHLVMMLIAALEQEIITPSLQGQVQEHHVKGGVLWGEKESAVGALVKLTGLLLKIIPLEQELLGNPVASVEQENLSLEDSAILKRYIERVKSEA